MAIPVKSDKDFLSQSRILNLPDPVLGGEAARKQYVDDQITANLDPNNWRETRLASTANINLPSPGTTFDGVTATNGDIILVKDQTTTSQNGVYIFDTDTTPMVRATFADTAEELEGMIVNVTEGTASGGVQYRQTEINFTLDTDPVLWTSFGGSSPPASETTAGLVEMYTQAELDAGTDDTNRAASALKIANSVWAKLKFNTDIGDGVATSYVVTHNLNSLDVTVSVFSNAGNQDKIEVEVQRTSVNSVTIVFSSAPASNSHRVVVVV